MKKLLLVSFLSLAVAFSVFADINGKTLTAEHVPGFSGPAGQGGGAGSCTLVYYNTCGGWIWGWSGWAAGDQIGINFDLPADCNKLPGDVCCIDAARWYWRYTSPNYGFTMTVNVYNTDASGCPTGASLGTDSYDPLERWNMSFVGAGICPTSDVVAVVATFDKGTLPYAASDQTAGNANAPNSCPGFVPGPGNSMVYGSATTTYCPPVPAADGYGVVNWLAQHWFTCSNVATEDASWGEIKSLFQ